MCFCYFRIVCTTGDSNGIAKSGVVKVLVNNRFLGESAEHFRYVVSVTCLFITLNHSQNVQVRSQFLLYNEFSYMFFNIYIYWKCLLSCSLSINSLSLLILCTKKSIFKDQLCWKNGIKILLLANFYVSSLFCLDNYLLSAQIIWQISKEKFL